MITICRPHRFTESRNLGAHGRMRQDALINTIGHNVALDAATQYNIQVIIAPYIEGELNKVRRPSDKTDLESVQSILPDFLLSMLPQEGNKASSRNNIDTHGPTGLGLPGFLQSRCFELLATFRKDWSKGIKDYCLSSPPAIESLKREHFESIATWLASSSSAIILIDVVNERRGSSWTTDLVLEMTDVFETANSESRASIGAVVAHLCRRENSKNYGEEGVLQTILAQIIEADSERFENPSKYQYIGLTEGNPNSVENRSEELWDMIVKCLKLARIRILVIILDHIEEIFLQGQTDDPDRFERFVKELNYRIKNLCTEHGIIVKAMVTCTLEEAASYFYEVEASSIVIRNPSRRRSRTFDGK
ncbi:hypothetical protein F4782DRAFT_318332 [Xylaria castorea]|nr:hypothetical protein F4782DRAFT_318332 [Xylaria castorea]